MKWRTVERIESIMIVAQLIYVVISIFILVGINEVLGVCMILGSCAIGLPAIVIWDKKTRPIYIKWRDEQMKKLEEGRIRGLQSKNQYT